MAMTVTLQGKAQRWSSGMGAAFRWVENYELRENVKE